MREIAQITGEKIEYSYTPISSAGHVAKGVSLSCTLPSFPEQKRERSAADSDTAAYATPRLHLEKWTGLKRTT